MPVELRKAHQDNDRAAITGSVLSDLCAHKNDSRSQAAP